MRQAVADLGPYCETNEAEALGPPALAPETTQTVEHYLSFRKEALVTV